MQRTDCRWMDALVRARRRGTRIVRQLPVCLFVCGCGEIRRTILHARDVVQAHSYRLFTLGVLSFLRAFLSTYLDSVSAGFWSSEQALRYAADLDLRTVDVPPPSNSKVPYMPLVLTCIPHRVTFKKKVLVLT